MDWQSIVLLSFSRYHVCKVGWIRFTIQLTDRGESCFAHFFDRYCIINLHLITDKGTSSYNLIDILLFVHDGSQAERHDNKWWYIDGSITVSINQWVYCLGIFYRYLCFAPCFLSHLLDPLGNSTNSA